MELSAGTHLFTEDQTELIVDEVTKYETGCGRCKTTYYGLEITGKTIDGVEFIAFLDTYTYWKCLCCSDKLEPNDIMIFKVYFNGIYHQWEYLNI